MSGIFSATPEIRHARSRAALWLSRLLEAGMPAPDAAGGILRCAAWALDGLAPVLRALEAAMEAMPPSRRTRDAAGEIARIRRKPGSRAAGVLEDILDDLPQLWPIATDAIRKACAAAAERAPARSGFAAARNLLGSLFGLDAASCDICELVFILEAFPAVAEVFPGDDDGGAFARRRAWAHVLGISPGDLAVRLERLEDCGILMDFPQGMDPSVSRLWENPSPEAARALFCRPLEGGTFPLDEFFADPKAVEHIRALMARDGDGARHILLYGGPGTGKTTFARSLAAALGVRAWAVPGRDDVPGRRAGDDRRAALLSCLHMASAHPGSIVVVDEAERILDTDFRSQAENNDKSWLNGLLERPGTRVVWITNHVDHMEQAVRRRFQFSLRFEDAGPAMRERAWRQIRDRRRIRRLLPDPLCAGLARRHDVPVAVVEQAVRQAAELHRTPAAFRSALELILSSYETLRADGRPPRRAPEAEEAYSLDGVRPEGESARDLLEACRRADALLRAGTLPPGGATLLFHGPSGTGKTALARHIAERLDRPCTVRRASDLIDMYVGSTERNIAAAFEEAEREGAVLVVDEADSFLFSRENARRSWELSAVNEFLTSLEDCRTFCICTTNLPDALDPAAMRRFTRKVAFAHAGPEQVLALYGALLAPLCRGPLPEDARRRLLALDGLTPGDFRVVRARHASPLAGASRPSHDDLVRALDGERALRMRPRSRAIGFGPGPIRKEMKDSLHAAPCAKARKG